MRAIDIDADLAALAKQARSVSHQRAALSVQGIALRVRAVLPEVTAVGLTWAAAGPFLEPAGYFTRHGQRLDTPAGDSPLSAGKQFQDRQITLLTEGIRDYCSNLGEANLATWSQFTTDEMPGGTCLASEYRLHIDAALPPPGPPASSRRNDRGTYAQARDRLAGVLASLLLHQPGMSYRQTADEILSALPPAAWYCICCNDNLCECNGTRLGRA